MARVAVLVDLGFFLPRYRSLIQMDGSPPHTPKKVARNLWRTALGHVDKDSGEQLYRILVYDCAPLSKKAHNKASIPGTAPTTARTEASEIRSTLRVGTERPVTLEAARPNVPGQVAPLPSACI